MKRILTGKIVSNKEKNTVIVSVERIVAHPKYKKRFIRNKRYHAHSTMEGLNVGDVVEIREIKPISKTKKWKVINKISSVDLPAEETKEEEI